MSFAKKKKKKARILLHMHLFLVPLSSAEWLTPTQTISEKTGWGQSGDVGRSSGAGLSETGEMQDKAIAVQPPLT